MPDYSMMDPALAALSSYGPDLRNGLTSHAPMAVEALAALGRPDAVMPWIERYRGGMLPRPSAREPITREGWRAALGREDRVADWSAFFGEELAEAPWREVLARWTLRLAPAVCASATHGVIRVAHAVRSLDDAESPLRLRELADGLGYWAAAYQVLPTGSHVSPGLSARAAIERVPIVPPAERRFSGTIVSSLIGLDDFPAFASVIDMLDVTGDPLAVLSEMTDTFARVYLTNARDVLGSIVFIHAVTSTAAVRTLVDHVPDATVHELLRYAWQAGCALYATFGIAPPARDVGTSPEGAEALVDRAIAHGDEHAIKFTEACLREHGLAPSPAYLAAARHALDVLPPA
jgi:hypothetical protein